MAKAKNVTLKLTERQAFGLAAIMASMDAKIMVNNAIRESNLKEIPYTAEEGKELADLILNTVFWHAYA